MHGVCMVELLGALAWPVSPTPSPQAWATAAHPTERTYDLLRAYHSPNDLTSTTYLHEKIMAAFAARRGARAYSLINVLVNFKYGFHEVDTGYTNTLLNNTDKLEGGS